MKKTIPLKLNQLNPVFSFEPKARGLHSLNKLKPLILAFWSPERFKLRWQVSLLCNLRKPVSKKVPYFKGIERSKLVYRLKLNS